jgi:hypothetical protein
VCVCVFHAILAQGLLAVPILSRFPF